MKLSTCKYPKICYLKNINVLTESVGRDEINDTFVYINFRLVSKISTPLYNKVIGEYFK
jgi:hypothetical protein